MPRFTKGMAKPPTSGRKPGQVNRTTIEMREIAQAHGPRAVARLVELLESDDPRAAIAAARELLDRGYGRPAQAVRLETEETPAGHAELIGAFFGQILRRPVEADVVLALPSGQGGGHAARAAPER